MPTAIYICCAPWFIRSGIGYADLKTALSRIKAGYTLVAVENDQLFKVPELRKSKQLLEQSGVRLTYHEFAPQITGTMHF